MNTQLRSLLLSLIALFVIQLFFVSTGNAIEGFSMNKNVLPSKVKKAWDSTFILINPVMGTSATAFVVKIDHHHPSRTVYFLTDAHALNDLGCSAKGHCEGAYFFHDFGFTPDMKGNYASGPHPLEVENINVIALSNNPDLGLISVEADESFNKIKPIYPDECNSSLIGETFLFGYPATDHRPNPLDGDKANDLLERWSVGLMNVETFTRPRSDKDPTLEILRPITADAIPGNSGGPSVNEEGKLIGVLQGSAAMIQNNYAYTGKETGKLEDANAFLTPCAQVKEFLEANLKGPE